MQAENKKRLNIVASFRTVEHLFKMGRDELALQEIAQVKLETLLEWERQSQVVRLGLQRTSWWDPSDAPAPDPNGSAGPTPEGSPAGARRKDTRGDWTSPLLQKIMRREQSEEILGACDEEGAKALKSCMARL